jgi:hypothetical protein
VVRGRLSVRQTEALVRTAKTKPTAARPKKRNPRPRATSSYASRASWAPKVEVRDKDGKGELAIKYAS